MLAGKQAGRQDSQPDDRMNPSIEHTHVLWATLQKPTVVLKHIQTGDLRNDVRCNNVQNQKKLKLKLKQKTDGYGHMVNT